MCTIGQGHEGEKRPVIVRGRVGAVLAAKPALDLRASGGSSVGPPTCSAGRLTWHGGSRPRTPEGDTRVRRSSLCIQL